MSEKLCKHIDDRPAVQSCYRCGRQLCYECGFEDKTVKDMGHKEISSRRGFTTTYTSGTSYEASYNVLCPNSFIERVKEDDFRIFVKRGIYVDDFKYQEPSFFKFTAYMKPTTFIIMFIGIAIFGLGLLMMMWLYYNYKKEYNRVSELVKKAETLKV